MIEDMYAVMNRIKELRERFGLVSRQAGAMAPKEAPTKATFDRELAAALDGMENAESVERYNKIAELNAERRGIPPSLVKAVIETESGYDPRAVSPKGAMGLMQLMPSVAQELGVTDPFEPAENIRAGVDLLGDLLKQYRGDYRKALAAYNAGPAAVNRENRVPDIPETKEYVKKVIDAYMKHAE